MQSFRNINDFERSILERMLSYDFVGKRQVRQQLEGAKVRTLDSGDNYGSIEFEVDSKAEAIDTPQRIPIELEAKDYDGVPIAALLHVINGKVDELEIYKADGTPIQKFPELRDFHRKVWPKN